MLPPELSTSAELLVESLAHDADIHDSRCCSACPLCVVSYLRSERMKNNALTPLPAVWRYEDVAMQCNTVGEEPHPSDVAGFGLRASHRRAGSELSKTSSGHYGSSVHSSEIPIRTLDSD